MSSSNCCFLTCIQVSQEAGRVVWLSHLFSNFPQNFSNGLCYRSYTNQCYISILFRRQQDNPSSRCEGTLIQRCEEKIAPAHRREGKRPPALWLPFHMFFLPLGLPCVNWASRECCLSCLRSSLQSSHLALLYFHGLFPSLSFSHRHPGLLFPILTT